MLIRNQPVGEAPPAWTPNGTRVAFISLLNAIELKAAAGTGDVTRLVESTIRFPKRSHRDGQILIDSDAGNIYLLLLEGGPTSMSSTIATAIA